MNLNDQYRLWTFVFLIRLTEQSVNHHLREFNIPQKNTNELGPAWHIAGNHRIRGQKKIAFSYSGPGGTLENKLNDLKPLFGRKIKRDQRKCSCYGGQILPTRINNNHWKLIYVTRTIPSSQYETNLWSTDVNVVRIAEPIRRCVRWRKQVFKIEGFVCKRFLPSPPPPPTFSFWLLFHFSRGQKPRIPFLGLSLLRNQTETLATQAIERMEVSREERFPKGDSHSIPLTPSARNIF